MPHRSNCNGARVDINKCVALGDIFIGVSRAALEAMAAGKPVIIAGNEGYIGIFNESTYPIALETNFAVGAVKNQRPSF